MASVSVAFVNGVPRWCVGWGLWHEARPVPARFAAPGPDPQLQQSIRLLQLSTLELGQEVEQMLDENPFSNAPPTKRRAKSLAWSMPTPRPGRRAQRR